MDVQITEEHIVRSLAIGGMGECNKCPIALALLDKGFTKAIVGEDIISFQANASWVDKAPPTWEKMNYITPKPVQHWICDFDNGKKVQPITVSLSKLASVKPI